MTSLQEIRNAQRADGSAAILAIGTANPTHCVYQDSFPDYYFRVTKSEHMTELKDKFRRICNKTMIRKRHVYLTEEILKENPSICAYSEPSLDAREKIMTKEVPKIGHEAALQALQEWGRPKSEITHVIFCSETNVAMPGADYELVKLLDLSLSVNRIMLYYQGCHGGGTVLRIAKDIAENNKDARILAVCAEVTAVTFRGPCETHIDSLVGQALFGDGACAMIIGSNPNTSIERPLFYLVSAAQRILPDSDGAIEGFLREIGLTFYLKKNVPALIADNIENCLKQAFQSIGINDWNSLFWAAHPGGSAILDYIESKLELKKEKLKATRHVLSEYGNMAGASVLFVLDEMRKSSLKKGQCTTGEGLEWGVLFGFGPGLTVETIVLRSVPI